MDDQELLEAFERDLKALVADNQFVELLASRWQLWSLMSAVQLAARHPIARETAPVRTAIAVARVIQARLSTTPALAWIAEQGWDLSDAADREPS